ncbi:MAG: DUF58 domain-containing protein [Gammaproteobacteria bacterium]|nr:DUF58 domain-containing protein [Gammaproteobacteria bacterium]
MSSPVQIKSIADDIVRVKASSLIALHRDAQSIPLNSNHIRAQLSGQYQSAFKGRGMIFDEVRPYQPGDDIRSIDWRVTARTGKAHTKLYKEERERPVLLWVDFRKPMFFATQGAFKSVVASRLAALLAWSTAQHGDRLGGLIFSENSHHELRPQRGRAATLHFINKLAEHPAWEQYRQADVDDNSGHLALTRLRRVTKPGSLIFLISDFRNMTTPSHYEAFQSNLMQLARHNDVVLLFISDPLESILPPAGLYRVSNGNNEVKLDTSNSHFRQEYQQRFEQHQEQLKQLCIKLGVYFLNISTHDDVHEVLRRGLGLYRRI